LKRNSAIVLAAATLGAGGALGLIAVALASSLDQGAAATSELAQVIVVAALVAVGVAAVFVRMMRRGRFKPGRCPRCGFDLRATRYRCPECGDVWLMRRD
jgi:predicted RNA-binding Zn-ribbon protein involved in translation (DUF1610 family)